jgi:hypothetical protein
MTLTPELNPDPSLTPSSPATDQSKSHGWAKDWEVYSPYIGKDCRWTFFDIKNVKKFSLALLRSDSVPVHMSSSSPHPKTLKCLIIVSKDSWSTFSTFQLETCELSKQMDFSLYPSYNLGRGGRTANPTHLQRGRRGGAGGHWATAILKPDWHTWPGPCPPDRGMPWLGPGPSLGKYLCPLFPFCHPL